MAQVLLDEVRLLRLDVDTDIHIQFLAHHAELHVDVLVIFRTLGETAQVGREITLIGIVEIAEQACPLAIVVEHAGKGLVGIDGGEVVGRGVALLMAVVIAVVQLQEHALGTERAHAVAVAKGSALLRLCGIDLNGFRLEVEEGLGVGETYLITEVVLRRQCVTVGLIGGVFAKLVFLLEEVHGREVGVLVGAIAVVDISADGYVAAFRSDAAVELQLRTGILVGAVAERLALTVVDHEAFFVQQFEALLAQGILDIVEGIGIKRGVGIEGTTVVGGETHVGTERQGGQRVDGPLQVHVARPTVIA